MSIIDWIVMSSFLLFVVIYGVVKTKGSKNVKEYLLANKTTKWYAITLSIMATQASAITFLSTPGQAYVDGLRFVQFYLGLPLAMIILSITAIPLYHKLNVYTAYEYLESRFDVKNRVLGSVLFLTQRGLAAGFTIFAPSLILSVILGWNIEATIIVIGGLVTIYTAVGGTNAVNKTHLQQMTIIFVGMITAFITIYVLLPDDISPLDAAYVAGKMGKLNAIDFTFDLGNKYTFWSGIIGGTFLMLSYFGTDQSQVQRYLSGSSVKESRIGLLVNGVVKIPMQFFILFIGAMVFVFYQFVMPPLYFNPVEQTAVYESEYADEYGKLEDEYSDLFEAKQLKIREMVNSIDDGDDIAADNFQNELMDIKSKEESVRNSAIEIVKKANPDSDANDTNYIFINFVINFLPVGMIGLVLAAILSASMSSTSAELNALASTTVIDIYKRLISKNESDEHYLKVSKIATIFWGIYAIIFASFANMLGSLIEAVNILGSLFYGTILGIFLVAFYFKSIKGTPTFIAAIIAEISVVALFIFTDLPYLWFNFVGCVLVVVIGMILNQIYFGNKKAG
ncbi:MAG: sodium:solute symporter [Melioribacteraceae bacterium]|nr:sodium:solute symporter [Melioribacteraceae bacterium]MCF8412906.1 sodium:solute symporter [Melioribacteraceae bacterium]MCF8432062.1 sodium:solute symporter [Melioribacteraceae bacterium]